ncbi:MAG: hypothetical protein RIR18_1958 [Pseudomonadota bacterium]|jgi:nitrogen fixation negative regulator NifL
MSAAMQLDSTQQLQEVVGAALVAGLPIEAYQQAVDQADLAVSITDSAAKILFVNQAFSRVTGYAPEEIVGQNQSVLSNRTTPSWLYQEMWLSLSAAKAWSGRLLNKNKNGDTYLAELTVSPVIDDAGHITHFLGMHRDVTELHRLERLVRNQKKLIESVIDGAPVAFCLIDHLGRVMLDNQAYKKLVSDLNVREPALSLMDSLLPAWRQRFEEDPEQCAFAVRETRIDRSVGGSRWLSVTCQVIETQSDCVDSYFSGAGAAGLLLVISDITSLRIEQERTRAATLKGALADVERTAAIRESLSAAIYKLGEPMNVMSSVVSLLQRRDPSSAAVLLSALNTSRDYTESLREMIPRGSPEGETSVNLNEVLRDVLDLSTGQMLSSGVMVDWNPVMTLPNMVGRPLQLRMLFKALMDNAIEAMDVKGWSRREMSITSAVHRDCIQIKVADTGPGIPVELRSCVFEPFFTKKSGKGKGQHMGTGLSRAYQVVLDHGGLIDIEDSAGGGCTMVVEFGLNGEPI